ncbi:MAG: type II toxin-antitoxin system RelE/ParE family toxin [Bacilli bacterium]|nr:type II toxin-antitoxin system RelE/ParE family toxin [Bacilli bacterium]
MPKSLTDYANNIAEIILSYLPLFRDNLAEAVAYIPDTLQNEKAANQLIDDVEEAILQRSRNPESFEPYRSRKNRQYPYYRIYVKNFVVCYVVLPGCPKTMEMRRFLYSGRNRQTIV